MGRPRLSDAEREAKRIARSKHSFSDAAYEHYDPSTEGYGSVEEWLRAVEALCEGRGSFKHSKTNAYQTQQKADLETLLLEVMPATIANLKTAFRNAMFVYHPDYGGSNDQARKAIEAFTRLKEFY